MRQVREAVEAFSKEAFGREAKVTGVNKTEEGWRVSMEVVEEKGFIDDILGSYELLLDEKLEVLSYKREGLRRRSDLALRA